MTVLKRPEPVESLLREADADTRAIYDDLFKAGFNLEFTDDSNFKWTHPDGEESDEFGTPMGVAIWAESTRDELGLGDDEAAPQKDERPPPAPAKPTTYYTILIELIKDIKTPADFDEFVSSHSIRPLAYADEVGPHDARFNPAEEAQLRVTLQACLEKVTPPPPAADPSPVEGSPASSEIRELAIEDIHIDSTIQSREQGTDMLKVAEYAEAMQRGDKFPPIRVFYHNDNSYDETYWLSQGFHRVPAAEKAGLATITAEILIGGRREAMLDSIGANASHGLPRTNADKRKAVRLMLEDPEWVKWSDGAIAKAASVSQPLVSALRRELESDDVISPTDQRTTLSGRTVKTENIGRAKDESTQNILSQPGAQQPLPSDAAADQKPSDDFDPTERQARLLNDLKSNPDGLHAKTLFSEQFGFTAMDIDAAVNAGLIEECDLPKHYHYKWTNEDIVRAIEERGVLSRLELEVLGVHQYAFNRAELDGDIKRNENEKFFISTLRFNGPQGESKSSEAADDESESDNAQPQAQPASQPAQPSQARAPERPSIESLLKGRMFTVGMVFMPAMPGKVTVSVNVGGNPQDTTREVLDVIHLRPLPEPLMRIIAKQLEKAPAAASTSPKKSSTTKSAKKKPAARAAKKAVKKTSAKKSTKRSAARR